MRLRTWEKRVCCIFLCVLCTAPAFLKAQDSNEQRLEEIANRVKRETENLAVLAAQQARLEKKLGDLRGQIESLEQKEVGLIDELALLRAQEEEALFASQTIREKLSALEELSLGRMKAMYVWRQADSDLLTDLLAGNVDFHQNSLYLRKIREADVALMNELNALHKLYEGRQKELAQVSHDKERVYLSLQEQRNQLAVKLQEQEAVSVELRKRRTGAERLLTSLKAEALRLEVVLRSMLVEAAKKKRKRIRTSFSFSTPNTEGVGIDAERASLQWPADGKVLRDFGSKDKGSFEDFVFSNGMEIACAEELPIRAIGAAKVVFLGNMAGYGKVVILDHGKRSYSLYGNLGEILVAQDDLVEAGEGIARCARRSSDQPGSVYLELRRGSKAEDPSRYLPSVPRQKRDK